MIQKIFALEDSHTLLYDKNGLDKTERIEIKFSTVMKENESKIEESNVIDQILKANVSNRALSSNDIDKYPFDCNIQQIKRTCFDTLYYGMFFSDKIMIFRLSSNEIENCPGYSDKQHRNNKGEGQFHINNKTFEFHKKHLVEELSYKKLYELFKTNKLPICPIRRIRYDCINFYMAGD